MKNSVKKVLPKYFLSLFVCLIISSNIFSTDFYPKLNINVDEGVHDDDRIKKLFLESAKHEYNLANWKEAKYAFYNYLLLEEQNSPERLEVLYYYAKSCFNASDYFTAVEIYTEYLSECLDSQHKIIAEWDRAIAAIKIDRGLAQKFLGDIAYDYGNKYHREAKELIGLL